MVPAMISHVLYMATGVNGPDGQCVMSRVGSESSRGGVNASVHSMEATIAKKRIKSSTSVTCGIAQSVCF